MTPLRPLGSLLERRARTAAGAPLLTHYGASGTRIELSAASFANWVAKTVNLLDDLGVEADAVVDLPVLADHPDHWMALVWPFALWQAGLAVRLGDPEPDVSVIGPEEPTPCAPVTVACSLDAWGRACPGLGPDVIDFSSEALAQPDAALATGPNTDFWAWVGGGHRLRASDITALPPIEQRVIAAPESAWESTSSLSRAILGGGSLVLTAPNVDLDRIAVTEKARPLRAASPALPEGIR